MKSNEVATMYDSEAKNRQREYLRHQIRWIRKKIKTNPSVVYLDGPDMHELKMYREEGIPNANLLRFEENKTYARMHRIQEPEIAIMERRLGVTMDEWSGRQKFNIPFIPDVWSMDFDGPLSRDIYNLFYHIPVFCSLYGKEFVTVYCNFMSGREAHDLYELIEYAKKIVGSQFVEDDHISRAMLYFIFLHQILTGLRYSFDISDDPFIRRTTFSSYGYAFIEDPKIIIYKSDSNLVYISFFIRMARVRDQVPSFKPNWASITQKKIIDLRGKSRQKPTVKKSRYDLYCEMIQHDPPIPAKDIAWAFHLPKRKIAKIAADKATYTRTGKIPDVGPWGSVSNKEDCNHAIVK